MYPLCPIFDLSEFHAKYKAGQVSPLVLQALYFVGAAHCDSSRIEKAGFSSRYMATFTFYQRAKALYDANYELDAIATVQALYLLSYWWGSPLEQKDIWHWTGLAVGLPQALGLHQKSVDIGILFDVAEANVYPVRLMQAYRNGSRSCGDVFGGLYMYVRHDGQSPADRMVES